MNEDGTFYVCEACQERVEPGEAGIIAARELITTYLDTGARRSELG